MLNTSAAPDRTASYQWPIRVCLSGPPSGTLRYRTTLRINGLTMFRPLRLPRCCNEPRLGPRIRDHAHEGKTDTVIIEAPSSESCAATKTSRSKPAATPDRLPTNTLKAE